MAVDFEKAFDDFLNRQECDEAQNALMDIIRISFQAGWVAAGGKPLKAQPIFKLMLNPCQNEEQSKEKI